MTVSYRRGSQAVEDASGRPLEPTRAFRSSLQRAMIRHLHPCVHDHSTGCGYKGSVSMKE